MRRSLIGVLVVALAAAGCGGESPAKKRQRFLAKANDVCRHFDDLQNQVRVPSVNPLSASISHADRARWALALKQIAQLGQEQVRVLQKLNPPNDLNDRFEAMVNLKNAAFADLAEGADAAKRNHRAEIKAPVLAGRKKLAQVATLAKEVGARQCA